MTFDDPHLNEAADEHPTFDDEPDEIDDSDELREADDNY